MPRDRDQIVIPHGQITIISPRCKGCGLCEAYCPRHVLEMSSEFNAKGYHIPEVTDAEGCVACGLCQIMCPEFAIYVTEINLNQDATLSPGLPVQPAACGSGRGQGRLPD